MTIFLTEHHTGFGDVNFGITWGGDEVAMPGWSQESHIVNKHVPGSNTTVTQLIGLGHAAITYGLLFESKREYNAFKALRQTRGVLTVYAAMCEFDMPAWEVVLFGETYTRIPDVLLVNTSDERPIADGSVECAALFQLQEWPS